MILTKKGFLINSYLYKLFTKTKKESPTDEISKNAELLIRASFIYKEMAGVYSILPLGLRVINKITNIIREEMNKVGGQEISMTALQDKACWEKTDRWDDKNVDNWFKTKLKNKTEVGLGFTHEEPLTNIMKEHISSYRDLPIYVYQFQTKFRNEKRAKSGILRGREFLMKDLYSFNKDEEDFNEFYDKMKLAYKTIFQRVGIGHITYLTYASGDTFGDYSHEFQTITSAGEDTIYLNEDTNIAVNKEVYTDEVLNKLNLDKDKLIEHRSIEVGNIFPLGTKFSKTLGLEYKTETGGKKPVIMGSYGIGLGRLMGAIVEVLADDKGLIWPESIAPFKVHLFGIGEQESEIKNKADEVYENFQKMGVEVLYDDRVGISAGEKLADADLIGIPYRIVISKRSLEAGGVEIKKRLEAKEEIIAIDKINKYVK